MPARSGAHSCRQKTPCLYLGSCFVLGEIASYQELFRIGSCFVSGHDFSRAVKWCGNGGL